MMDYVKQALFNVLANRVSFTHIKVLDLFAGSGQLGIECLSRGAQWVVFNDHHSPTAQLINTNLQRVGAGKSARVDCCDFRTALARLGHDRTRFNLIFVDPPFACTGYLTTALADIRQQQLLTANGMVVVQTQVRHFGLPAGWQPVFVRQMKAKWVMLLC